MTISLSFSAFIYQSVSNEFQRRLLSIEQRFELGTGVLHGHGPIHQVLIEDLNEARWQVLIILIYANGTILFFSSLAGYYLAGKTLHPIEQAVEEQKRFIADASHELKTPLTALRTTIEVGLRDKKLSLKNAKTLLNENLESLESIQNLLSNLLHLAIFETNNKVTISEFDLSKTIKSEVKKFSPLAKEKDIKIIHKILKFITIKSDEDKIRKLLSILIDNAIKYTKKGDITISASHLRRSVIIKVKDTGIGISKKDLPHIFDRFYRADSSRSKLEADGYGLGLCLANRIVKELKGKISVVSEPNKGSTFTIKLPKDL